MNKGTLGFWWVSVLYYTSLPGPVGHAGRFGSVRVGGRLEGQVSSVFTLRSTPVVYWVGERVFYHPLVLVENEIL